MGVLAIALFGSRARGDHGPASDTDLLLLTDEPGPRKIVEGKLSLSFYPVDFLLERARCGDLFVAHIVLEAKPLHDPDDLLGGLRAAYVPAADLDDVIRRATDLGRFVIANWPALDAVGLVDRRTAWTVRTILIARAMRVRGPNFATSDLVSFSGDPSVADLIGAKEEPSADAGRLQMFEAFLDTWGDPRSPRSGDVEAFRQLFDDTGNSFGLSTVRRLSGERATIEDY
ncbi:MAG: nucleotidyltransferase domain-containing protein [Pseudomonadota bacterium]|nr:nucleotidyltransferase domain-containing protein [Pseudomonadota bacterium]